MPHNIDMYAVYVHFAGKWTTDNTKNKRERVYWFNWHRDWYIYMCLSRDILIEEDIWYTTDECQLCFGRILSLLKIKIFYPINSLFRQTRFV